MEIEDLFDVVQ